MKLFKLLLLLFARPAQTIDKILREKITFREVIVFLGFIGLLRGIIDVLWTYLMAGSFGQLPSFLREADWRLYHGGFLLANVLTVYSRWIAYSLISFGFGRFLGGKGDFRDFLKIYGVVSGVYLLTIFPNFIYLFVNLPAIRYPICDVYSPIRGIGQGLTSLWLAFISYKVVLKLQNHGVIGSIFIGLLVPLLSTGFYILAALLFFNLPFLSSLPSKSIFFLAVFSFSIVTLFMIPVLFWMGDRLSKKNKGTTQKENDSMMTSDL